MRRKAGNTRAAAANHRREAEPQAATTATRWWEQDLGKLLRESEAARRRNGRIRFDDAALVYTGYPPRYKYEGSMYGDYVVSYLNNVLTGKKVGVRLRAFTSLSILSVDEDGGVERITNLVEQLRKLDAEPLGAYSRDIIDEINHLLAFYADRQTIFVDGGQSKTATKRGIVFQREPPDFVVVDRTKLRESVAHLVSGLDELEQEKNAGAAREQLTKSLELVDEAIERGPSAEEHRVHYYVIELFERGLLDRLRRCACSCGCGRWLFQRRHTHTVCEECRAAHHIKNDEVSERRKRQARQRYQLKKGNVL